MIKSIHISNYALIDRVDIELNPGLNIITGETGAGKSIILGALSLLLGGRADTKVVADTSKKSVIEAVVEIEHDASLKTFFEENSLDSNDDGMVILRREVAPNGRSRAFINDSPVNLSVLEQLSRRLIDIHSQHQNLLLADPAFQLRIIDALAGNAGLLGEYRKHYDEYRGALREYNTAKKQFEKTKASESEIRKQLERIDDLNLLPDEQEELEKEKETLSNYVSIKESLGYIVEKLVDAEESVVGVLKQCVRESEDIKELVPDGEQLSERLNSVYIELADIASSYETIDSDLTDDPRRIEYVEDRLNAIYKLQTRFGVDSVQEVLDIAERLRNDLDMLDEGEQHLLELQKKAKQKRSSVLEAAKVLSSRRREEARRFVEMLAEKAAPLGMKNLRGEADASYTSELTPDGIDHIEFKFAFNKNQEPLTISRTASGGEISRLMLCVKSLLASRIQLPTIIFDEIDTGVSGEIANRMGQMMLDIAAGIQVLAITHLPQVAAKGNTHFKVYKEDDEQRTNTRLQLLDPKERIQEIARMLSGSEINHAAVANAVSLLNN